MNNDKTTSLLFMIAMFVTFMWIMQYLFPPPVVEEQGNPPPANAAADAANPAGDAFAAGQAAAIADAAATATGAAAEADATEVFTVTVARAGKPDGSPDERGYEATFTTQGAGLARYKLLGYFRKSGEREAGDEVILAESMVAGHNSLAVDSLTAAIPDRVETRRSVALGRRIHTLRRVPENAVVRLGGAILDPLPDHVERGGDELVMSVFVKELNIEVVRVFDFSAPAAAPSAAPSAPAADGAASKSPPFGFSTAVRLVNRGAAAVRANYWLSGPSGMLPDDRTRSKRFDYIAAQLDRVGGSAVNVQSVPVDSLKENESRQDSRARLAWVGYRNRFFAALLATEDRGHIPGGIAEMRKPTASLEDSALPRDLRRLLSHVHSSYRSPYVAAPEILFDVWNNDPIAPGAALEQRYRFYGGPAEANRLEAADPRFTGIVVYTFGWLDPLARLIVWVLTGIHAVVANYGLAMILLTIIIKTLMHPLTRKMYISGQKMQLIQPQVKELRKKYGAPGDQQKLMQETQKLYRENNVSMAGGCLPMLIQMPIFFALYGAFAQSFSLRQADFIPAWIPDLSLPDSVYTLAADIPFLGSPEISLLPVLYLALQFLQMSLQPVSPDPQVRQQQKIMKFMPLFFVFIFYAMPSGLVLYFTASSLYSVIESLYIRRKFPPLVPGSAGVGVEGGVPVAAAQVRDHSGVGMGTHQGKKKKKK